jgi:hypothetical protein
MILDGGERLRRGHLANVWIIASLLAGLAVCQADKKQALALGTNLTAQPAAGPAQTPAPKPGAQMEKLLRAFQGTWAVNERIAPDPSTPNGATGEGSIVWRPGPGGFSVVEDYQSKQGAREVTGLAVFWWDESGGYRTIWCDSTNPGGISFKNVARWDGAKLVLVEDYEMNGKKFTFKEVFGDITPGSFTQTLYGGEAGGNLKVDQVIRATKSRARSAWKDRDEGPRK